MLSFRDAEQQLQNVNNSIMLLNLVERLLSFFFYNFCISMYVSSVHVSNRGSFDKSVWYRPCVTNGFSRLGSKPSEGGVFVILRITTLSFSGWCSPVFEVYTLYHCVCRTSQFTDLHSSFGAPLFMVKRSFRYPLFTLLSWCCRNLLGLTQKWFFELSFCCCCSFGNCFVCHSNHMCAAADGKPKHGWIRTYPYFRCVYVCIRKTFIHVTGKTSCSRTYV
jgi:hypothetical protein